MPNNLIEPHGGKLVELLAGAKRVRELKSASSRWPSWTLTPRQLCDLELLLNGAFSPLGGFMTRADYESVCDTMQLDDGTLWPVPITLDLSEEAAVELSPGESLALRDPEGVMIAVLHIDELWRPDLLSEAKRVYGTQETAHPGVARLLEGSGAVYAGGRVEGIQLPLHFDFPTLRLGPADARRHFSRLGWRRIVAFQTRSPMHRSDHEVTLRAATQAGANLLIHPLVGQATPGDLDHYTRVHCYEAILPRYPQQTVKLALLPLALRMAGPREALWHAIVRKNFGCTHMIVGPDQAAADADGKAFYAPDEAQELLRRHEDELGVTALPFKKLVYVEDEDSYMPEDEAPDGARVLDLSGSELRCRLAEGREIPAWFTFPEVSLALRRRYPPRYRQGFTVFFTGLSGAGKSTIANALRVKFLEMGGRPVTLLDGDIVRRNLSSELGFSKEHRNVNIRRIGFVASEITKNGGIAICAPIAPYEEVRHEVRQMIEPLGGFILVHVDTPLEICEERDRKGLYAKARAGLIKEFTGISDPYEIPGGPDVVIRTTELTPEEAAQEVLLHLEKQGYVGVNGEQ